MLDLEKKEVYIQLSSMPYPMILGAEDKITVTKNAELSSKARQEGNLLYQQKNHDSKIHEKIWEKYSKSIALAPIKSNELALGYGNRSALLLHLRKYEDCIKDIDKAISISKSNSFKVKLICRKIKCQVNLRLSYEESLKEIDNLLFKINENKGEKKALHEMLNKTISFIDDLEFKQSEKNEDLKVGQVFNLKNTDNDFSSVTVKYDNQKGKYLIANRDFEPGEVIFVETFYAKIMDFKKAYAFCAHCLEQCWSLIPCHTCSLSMFCSDKCRKEAWEKYHDIECHLFSGIQTNTQFDFFYQLGIRTLILGVREAGSISKLEAQLKSSSKGNPLKPFMKNEIVQSSGIISICHLRSYIVEPILKMLTEFCSLVALLLAKRTNFFGKPYTWTDGIHLLKDSNFMFAAALLLKLTKISMSSCRTVANQHLSYKDESDEKLLNLNFCTRGAYLSPIGCLTNHHCNPNAGRSCITVNKIAIYALHPIKKNSEIFETYANSFYNVPKEIREQFMIARYENLCKCIACKNDWPPILLSCEKHQDIPAHKHIEAFCKSPIEKKIYKFNEEAIRLSEYEHSAYKEELIENLSKGISKCMKVLMQPSILTCELIVALKKIFDRLYGIKFSVPSECAEF